MLCEGCRWWVQNHASPEICADILDVIGACHRNPPVLTGGMMSPVATCWPVTKRGDFCGDFLPINYGLVPALSGTKPIISRVSQPKIIAGSIEIILRDSERPMVRSEIVAALNDMGVNIPGVDKPRYVGTIIHRNKETFRHIEGCGYWLCSEPYPPIPPRNEFDVMEPR